MIKNGEWKHDDYYCRILLRASEYANLHQLCIARVPSPWRDIRSSVDCWRIVRSRYFSAPVACYTLELSNISHSFRSYFHPCLKAYIKPKIPKRSKITPMPILIIKSSISRLKKLKIMIIPIPAKIMIAAVVILLEKFLE